MPQWIYKITSCLTSRHPFRPLLGTVISQSFDLRLFTSLRYIVLAVIPDNFEFEGLDPDEATTAVASTYLGNDTQHYMQVSYSPDLLQQSTFGRPVASIVSSAGSFSAPTEYLNVSNNSNLCLLEKFWPDGMMRGGFNFKEFRYLVNNQNVTPPEHLSGFVEIAEWNRKQMLLGAKGDSTWQKNHMNTV